MRKCLEVVKSYKVDIKNKARLIMMAECHDIEYKEA